MRVQHERVRSDLASYGCSVIGEIVKSSKNHIESLVECRRKRNSSVRAQNREDIAFTSFGQATLISDIDSGILRPATRTDLIHAIQVIKHLPNTKISHPAFIPQDVPPMVRDIHAFSIHAAYYGVKEVVSVFSKASVPYLFEMATVHMDNAQSVGEHPPFHYMLPISNFQVSTESGDILYALLDRGIRCPIGMVMPVLGGSTPITLAALLVAQTAESFGAAVIADALYGDIGEGGFDGGPATLDLSSLCTAQSSPEAALLYLATMDMSRHYGVSQPQFAYALSADSKVSDVQTGMEKAVKAVLAALAGAPTLGSEIGVLATASIVGLPQMIIDYELCGLINRLLRGILVTKESLGVKMQIENNNGHFYLEDPHTTDHFKEEIFLSKIFNRDTAQSFTEKGGDMLTRAKDRVKMIQAKEPELLIRVDQIAALARIVSSAENQIS